jgi:hypothetical protein
MRVEVFVPEQPDTTEITAISTIVKTIDNRRATERLRFINFGQSSQRKIIAAIVD